MGYDEEAKISLSNQTIQAELAKRGFETCLEERHVGISATSSRKP